MRARQQMSVCAPWSVLLPKRLCVPPTSCTVLIHLILTDGSGFQPLWGFVFVHLVLMSSEPRRSRGIFFLLSVVCRYTVIRHSNWGMCRNSQPLIDLLKVFSSCGFDIGSLVLTGNCNHSSTISSSKHLSEDAERNSKLSKVSLMEK